MERLRQHLRAHNCKVAAISLVTAVAAAVLWLGLYGLACWMYVLFASIAHPLEGRPAGQPVLIPFIATAAALCVGAWMLKQMRPNAAAGDYSGADKVALDLLLCVPRLTLSIFGTAGAGVRLTGAELEQAWDLLRRMREAEGPMPVQEAPLSIPEGRSRERILLALQVSGLVEVRRGKEGNVLAFSNDEARRLATERVHLRV